MTGRSESPYRADLRNLARLAVVEGLFLLIVWPCQSAVHALIKHGEVGWAQVVAVPVLALCFANLGWLAWTIFRRPDASGDPS